MLLDDKYNVVVPDTIVDGGYAEVLAQRICTANHHRLERYNEEFDPIAGINAPPMPRFELALKEFTWMLPETMRDMEIVKQLQRAKSIKKFCKKHNIQGHEEDVKWKLTYFRCMHDFCFWAATCCTVKDKRSGQNVRFILNWPQRKTLTELERMRLADMPIRMIILKARQWGGSTLVQMYMAWIQLMLIEGRNSAIVAHLNSASLNIRAMYMRMIKNYPPKMLGLAPDTEIALSPFNASRNDYTIKRGREQVRNMIISVGSMQSPDSIRGQDIGLVHFSEVGIWKATEQKTPEEVIQATQSSVLAMPLTMVVMESTAKGENNLFHHEWLDAKNKVSDKSPVFVPWYEIDQYRIPFINDMEMRNFARVLLMNRNEHYTKNTRGEPGSYLWWLWQQGAPLEGIRWYIEQRKAYRDHDSMASEFPSDDIEAFATTGTAIFDRNSVDRLQEDCMPPIEQGEIRAKGIDGKEAFEDVKFYKEANGELSIWKMPDTSFEHRDRYLVAVDVGGRSAKADWSVIVVIDRWGRTLGKGDEIVAQWHGHLRHDLLAWKMAQIATFYCNALLVVESNTFETRSTDTEGEHSAYILDQIGREYRNLYTRETPPENVRKGRPGRKWGFQTNVRTKPLIIDNLIRIVEDHLYIERDEDALHEYRVYQRDNNGGMNAAEGEHDDRLMARAIGLYISENMPEPKKVDKNVFRKMRTRFKRKNNIPNESDF